MLAVALIYTSFSAATDTKEPSQLFGAPTGVSYDMNAEVVRGSVHQHGSGISFDVTDREGKGKPLPVTYTGTVPDPFRGGREIVLTGAMKAGTFVGEPETLITKCPSKFTTQSNG
jgi:cytochrome c-type biogenesis protein CcmE